MPLADVVTPNLEEAARLAGLEAVSADAPWERLLPWLRTAAAELRRFGCRAVVITGGHLKEPNDFLSYVQNRVAKEEVLPGVRIQSGSTHGTGCAFATSIACQLALGKDIPEAVRAAKEYVTRAIQAAYPLGKGIGPINHIV